MATTPRIYCTNLVTGEYLPEIEAFADADPLTPGNWLIPAGAYLDAPPAAGGNQAVLRKETGWVLVDDHRGNYFRTDTGAPERHIEFGPLPDHLTATPPPSSDHVWLDGKWTEDLPAKLARSHAQQYLAVNSACEAAITAGFSSYALGAPHFYSSQLDDQLNLTGAVLRGLDMPYACRDEQGVKGFRLHTAEQLRQVGDDFTLYKLQLLQHANELKQQLDAALDAGDLAALEAISWEAPQP